jgi:regulator of RNase E activity RraA
MLSQEILEGFNAFDSATIFNAVVKKLGLPNEDYTDHRIRCLLPDTGPVVGYAVTAEVTTNDADSVAAPWEDYYEALHRTEGPVVAVLRDVDSRPGRGASFGDGMARLHKKLGTVGVLVEGTVRDLAGIGEVGLPVWAWGTVPGHGVFCVTRVGGPVTVGSMRVRGGDLIFADGDGAVRIQEEHAEEVLQLAAEVRAFEAEVFAQYEAEDFTFEKWKASR